MRNGDILAESSEKIKAGCAKSKKLNGLCIRYVIMAKLVSTPFWGL
jgi:hypothetical protein